MVFLYTPFFCLSSPSFSVALSYCISYTCIVLFYFYIRLLLRTNIKVQIFLSASIIYPTFRKVWCFYCYKNVFKTSSTSLLLCYIHVLLFKGKTNLLNFTPFRKFLSATVGVDNHKLFAAIVWWFKCTAKAGQ